MFGYPTISLFRSPISDKRAKVQKKLSVLLAAKVSGTITPLIKNTHFVAHSKKSENVKVIYESSSDNSAINRSSAFLIRSFFSVLYDLPIYPVVIFSFDEPKRAEPKIHRVTFPDLNVLEFQFAAIQLNRLSWRDFITQPNPVAAALMAKMNIAPSERPQVKAE